MTRSQLLLALGLAAGCGDGGAAGADAALADAALADAGALDATPPPDADPDAPDLGCLGDPAPSVAADPLEVTGKVFAVADYQVTAFAGAAVELHRRDGGGLVGDATTDAEGAFAISVAGGAAVDAVVVVTAADHLPTRAYPADPLIGGEDLLLIVVDTDELAAWHEDVGDVLDPGDRTVVGVVVDCARDPIRGATLAVAPAAATLTYYDDQAQRWDPALTASSNGFSLATGAAASVTLTSAPLPPRTVPAAADELTLALISPYLAR